jgi:hypothetical protein
MLLDLVALILCSLSGAKTIDEALHSTVRTEMSQLMHLDITGPRLKWDCADAFQQQCYPLLAAWDGDYLEPLIVAQV